MFLWYDFVEIRIDVAGREGRRRRTIRLVQANAKDSLFLFADTS